MCRPSLPAAPPGPRPEVCKFYLGTGCKFGSVCRYLHAGRTRRRGRSSSRSPGREARRRMEEQEKAAGQHRRSGTVVLRLYLVSKPGHRCLNLTAQESQRRRQRAEERDKERRKESASGSSNTNSSGTCRSTKRPPTRILKPSPVTTSKSGNKAEEKVVSLKAKSLASGCGPVCPKCGVKVEKRRKSC